ncbi:hypothetical protein [Kribbella karoonensis]|uniref:Protein RecA n=1 Tax=Kribbella karoonensis TaxID=324851 RepID=A0ABN2EBM6_9ACTN
MTGNAAPESRVTALDQARALLARAKAQKAAAGQASVPVLEDSPPDRHPPAGPVRLATVASFDPDLVHQPEPGTGERLAAVDGGRTSSPARVQRGTDTARVQRGTDTARVQRGTDTARVQQALDTAGVERELPTHPAVRELLAGAGLRGGSAYSVRGSAALVMALMAGPSADGAWCGVVGVPSFGAEAARGLGVDLERLVLVPDPGREWLSVVAALVDALTVVVVRPPGEVTSGEASRLAARLRTRGAMLIAYGSWPGSEARFEIETSTWTGLGEGEGLLTARRATVAVTGRRAAVRARRHQLWLPAPDGEIRPVERTTEHSADEWAEQIGAVG